MTSFHTTYRPLTWADVLGQDAAVKSLKAAAKNKRQHAYIFTGPSGCGKTTLARIMAKQLAGTGASDLNIEEIPAADHTGVDDMRRIVNSALYRAMGVSAVKAFIIDEAHRLSSAAFDVLLKPIEEPPEHAYWFFCSTNPGKIPKTIQTRCVKFDLKPVAEELLLELLVKVADAEKLDLADDVLEAVAEGAGGSPRQALVFLEAVAYCESAAEARTVMRSAGQQKEAIDLARFLMKPQGRSWAEAIKLVKSLEGVDAESIRITLVNYLSAVLMNIKSEKQALPVLRLLSCFDTSYISTDRMAPLLNSLGLALGLDQQ